MPYPTACKEEHSTAALFTRAWTCLLCKNHQRPPAAAVRPAAVLYLCIFPAVQMSLVPVMTMHAHTLCAACCACARFSLPGVLMPLAPLRNRWPPHATPSSAESMLTWALLLCNAAGGTL